MRSLFVCGPQGCGKTRHADEIAEHFGLDEIEDGTGSRDIPAEGVLVLSGHAIDEWREWFGPDLLGYLFITYDDAMASIAASKGVGVV